MSGREEDRLLALAAAVDHERRGDELWRARRYLWAMEEFGKAEAAAAEAARLLVKSDERGATDG